MVITKLIRFFQFMVKSLPEEKMQNQYRDFYGI